MKVQSIDAKNMDQSEIRNKISSFCLTFSGLPTDTDVNPQTIVSNVRGANNAHLLRTASGDEKWLILFNSKNDVEDYLKNLQIDLQLNDNTYEVKVEKSVPCDIPAEWSNQECFNWLQQSGQCQGQFPSQNYFHQQPQEFQQGQHQGHVSSQTYQFPGAQEFQQAHQGGITTQGQQQQMYPGPYYPNPYCIPPFQYPYSPTQGQSNYQNVPQTQNNNNLFQGFPQPGYPHVGPTFYENTRYYNNGMYGNYGRPYLQHGQRPPPPPYQQINATNSNQMAATAQNDSSTHMHHVQMTPEATIQQSQMTPTAPNEASKQQSHMTPNAPYDDTTQVQINPTGAYDSENESSEETLKKQEPYPQMPHEQQYYTPMPMPMPSAPWEVSTEKKEVVDTEIYETRNDNSDPEKTSMIKVSNLPRNTTVDSLTFFFENRRVSGGGPTKDVDFDDSDFTAIITFEESDGNYY
ncbi:hypothetical protein KUTeg_002223 [Tegillarca granosa]|uniref:Uncharacterized protein n=1 Tax=Tegillarca granosa TaxID=220873 RepID=A0ABQ9FWX2_TEGGR|nr:hypothetical protein KUTeg_002223 [Tegillarca granosa]